MSESFQEHSVVEFIKNPASFIDHTNLKPNSLQSDIDRLCEEAIRFKFKSVCVHPYWISRCQQNLVGSDVKICTVIGFPLGANASSVKAFETKTAIEDGATEIDLVINVGLFLSMLVEPQQSEGHSQLAKCFKQDLLQSIAHITPNIILKVIIETSLLNSEQISVVSDFLAEIPQVSFVKTSTGFSGPGASVENVGLIKKAVRSRSDVKASGGIKTWEDCLRMVRSGAGRIGTSSGVSIMREWSEIHPQVEQPSE